jgi:hypothetical protein
LLVWRYSQHQQQKSVEAKIGSMKKSKQKSRKDEVINLWSISPTFYEPICANIFSPKKVQT